MNTCTDVETTSMRSLPPPAELDTGTLPCNSKIKLRRTIPSPLLACEDHYHSMQPLSCPPWCRARYYICPVYCGFCADPPQLLSPARAYVSGVDRSEYSQYSHCPAPHCTVPSLPWRTLERHLISPPIEASAGRSSETVIPSRVRYSSLPPPPFFPPG